MGDSRILLFDHDDELIYSSEDHKVTTPKVVKSKIRISMFFACTGLDFETFCIERARILESGAKIHAGRIFGMLAVARAFGDFQYRMLSRF